MKYLTLAAEYSGPILEDISEGGIEPESLGLPEDLCAALRSWNDAYKIIIPMGEERQTEPVQAKIADLDRRGLVFCRQIEELLGEAKVEYFSEGLLRRIWRSR